jgi:hypothetical protein
LADAEAATNMLAANTAAAVVTIVFLFMLHSLFAMPCEPAWLGGL